jgi:hypothetical protein
LEQDRNKVYNQQWLVDSKRNKNEDATNEINKLYEDGGMVGMQAENLANEIAQWATNRRAQLENRKQWCERFGYLLFALGWTIGLSRTS